MKNTFQKLIKSANKGDQATCETKDLGESFNRRNGRFKTRSLFWIPSHSCYDGDKEKLIWFAKSETWDGEMKQTKCKLSRFSLNCLDNKEKSILLLLLTESGAVPSNKLE